MKFEIPFDLRSRDGSLSKGQLLTNATGEGAGLERILKRPGVTQAFSFADGFLKGAIKDWDNSWYVFVDGNVYQNPFLVPSGGSPGGGSILISEPEGMDYVRLQISGSAMYIGAVADTTAPDGSTLKSLAFSTSEEITDLGYVNVDADIGGDAVYSYATLAKDGVLYALFFGDGSTFEYYLVNLGPQGLSGPSPYTMTNLLSLLEGVAPDAIYRDIYSFVVYLGVFYFAVPVSLFGTINILIFSSGDGVAWTHIHTITTAASSSLYSLTLYVGEYGLLAGITYFSAGGYYSGVYTDAGELVLIKNSTSTFSRVAGSIRGNVDGVLKIPISAAGVIPVYWSGGSVTAWVENDIGDSAIIEIVDHAFFNNNWYFIGRKSGTRFGIYKLATTGEEEITQAEQTYSLGSAPGQLSIVAVP